MEPKITSSGHGNYRVTFWSYKDQVWKHLKGSKNISSIIEQHINVWKTFISFVTNRLKKAGFIVEMARDTPTKVIFMVLLEGGIVEIIFKKENLLKMRIKRINFGGELYRLERACKECVLDVDFLLDN